MTMQQYDEGIKRLFDEAVDAATEFRRLWKDKDSTAPNAAIKSQALQRAYALVCGIEPNMASEIVHSEATKREETEAK